MISFPGRRSVLSKGWWLSHVHVRTTGFIFRRLSAGSRLRSAPKLIAQLVGVLTPVPLGFCCGGFSSTAGYVPGNEASRSEDQEAASCTFQADHFLKDVRSFYPPNLVRPEGRSGTSLSASAPSVPDGGFPLLPSSNGHVTVSVPPLGAGQNHRSDLDCDAILHP